MQMEMLIYSDITENYPISEIYSEVTFLHMRGITTPKGMQMVDAFTVSKRKALIIPLYSSKNLYLCSCLQRIIDEE